jgi:uncharacterized protein
MTDDKSPVEEWIQQQLLERQPPASHHGVMFQRWVHLLFLHWKFDPEMIQRTLPRGLSVDTHAGMAWVGVVPFCMRRVRPTLLQFLSSDFLELNLRTYVRDRNGRPGVWFYSLDASHPLAVWTARVFFGLPYMHAKMQVAGRDGEIAYSCQRHGSSTRMEYRFRPCDDLAEAKIGSLEFFLVERYRLFSVRCGRLLTGRVYHSPYELRNALVSKLNKGLFELDDLQSPPGPPNNVLYSPGVDVTVYPVQIVR